MILRLFIFPILFINFSYAQKWLKQADEIYQKAQEVCDPDFGEGFDSKACKDLLKKYTLLTGEDFDGLNLLTDFQDALDNLEDEMNKIEEFLKDSVSTQFGEKEIGISFDEPRFDGNISFPSGDLSYKDSDKDGFYEVYLRPYAFDIQKEIFDGMILNNDFVKDIIVENEQVFLVDDIMKTPLKTQGLKLLTPGSSKGTRTKSF